tara:strand:- start:565 stop:963 length:399 start_codon:yes stop_codon:yes gene_type:complete
MRIAIDLDEVIMSRSNELINDSKNEFDILRKWAGTPQHQGKHQLICLTARGRMFLKSAFEVLEENKMYFDEYHFLGGRHKYVVQFDYLIDNSLVVYENLKEQGQGDKFIQFWTPLTDKGIKRLSEALDVING